MKYYSITQSGGVATVYIFDDIYDWHEDGASLATEIMALTAERIDVYINSYGGAVTEALSVYNALRSHTAEVHTYSTGIAASAAADIFMAGDKRHMYPSSLLMIHNPWTLAVGNAEELRKVANDLDIFAEASNRTLRAAELTITDEELDALLAAESFIGANNALAWGFATAIVGEPKIDGVAASARMRVCQMLSPLPQPPNDAPGDGGKTPAAAATPSLPEEGQEPGRPNARTFFNFTRKNGE